MYSLAFAKLGGLVDLPPAEEEELRAILRDVKTIGAGEIIYRERDASEEFHVILTGWAARYRLTANGSRQITALLLPGDFADRERLLLDQADSNVAALTAVTVAYVKKPALIALLERSRALSTALWQATILEASILRAWITNVGRRDAYAATAHLLCELHHRVSLLGLVEKGDEFALPLRQNDLADCLGLTGVHTNRTLLKLRADGLISLRHRKLTILDRAGLVEAAGFDPYYLRARVEGR